MSPAEMEAQLQAELEASKAASVPAHMSPRPLNDVGRTPVANPGHSPPTDVSAPPGQTAAVDQERSSSALDQRTPLPAARPAAEPQRAGRAPHPVNASSARKRPRGPGETPARAPHKRSRAQASATSSGPETQGPPRHAAEGGNVPGTTRSAGPPPVARPVRGLQVQVGAFDPLHQEPNPLVHRLLCSGADTGSTATWKWPTWKGSRVHHWTELQGPSLPLWHEIAS